MQAIAIMGSIGAGKDSLKEYLARKYKFHAVKLGNILRGEARARGVEATRDSLFRLSRRLKKKDRFFLPRRALAEAEKNRWRKLVITDIRELDDVRFLKERFGRDIKFIRVEADQKIRFERVKQRGRADAPETLAEFKKVDAREAKRFNFRKLFKLADFAVNNDGGYEQLYREADRVLRRI